MTLVWKIPPKWALINGGLASMWPKIISCWSIQQYSAGFFPKKHIWKFCDHPLHKNHHILRHWPGSLQQRNNPHHHNSISGQTHQTISEGDKKWRSHPRHGKLFKVWFAESSKTLHEEQDIAFRHTVVQALFLSGVARPDIKKMSCYFWLLESNPPIMMTRENKTTTKVPQINQTHAPHPGHKTHTGNNVVD